MLQVTKEAGAYLSNMLYETNLLGCAAMRILVEDDELTLRPDTARKHDTAFTFGDDTVFTRTTVNGPARLQNTTRLTIAGSILEADLDNSGELMVSAGAASTINGALTTDGNSLIRLIAVGGNPGAASQLNVSNDFTNEGRLELFSDNTFWRH